MPLAIEGGGVGPYGLGQMLALWRARGRGAPMEGGGHQ
jgi:hypothetical protein